MADTKISALSAATALTGVETMPVVQSSATVKSTVQQMVTAATGSAGMTGTSVAVSTPLLNFTQTWNGAGQVFTASKISVTNTASDALSRFVDYQLGASSQYHVRYNGTIFTLGNLQISGQVLSNGNDQVVATQQGSVANFNTAALSTISGAKIGFSASATVPSSTTDTSIGRVSAGVLGAYAGGSLGTIQAAVVNPVGGTITASAPIFDATQTWNNAAVTFTGLKLNITDTASAAAALLLDMQVGGTSQFSVSKAARVSIPAANLAIAVDFGGNTASFPALRRNGAQLEVLTGDLSNWTTFKCRTLTLSGGELLGTQFKFLDFNGAGGNGVSVQNTAGSVFADLKLLNLLVAGTAGSYVQTPSMTVANLAVASTAGAGARAFVTDASTTVILGLGLTVTGGGANKVPVYSDGTNWLIG